MARKRNESSAAAESKNYKRQKVSEEDSNSSKKRLLQKQPQQLTTAVESVAATDPESDFLDEPAVVLDDEIVENNEIEIDSSSKSPAQRKTKRRVAEDNAESKDEVRFIGEPIPQEEARLKWPHHYQVKEKQKSNGGSKDMIDEDDSEELKEARQHYEKAIVDGQVFNLGDDAYVQADDEKKHYICKIVEMFEAVDGKPYFTSQWFYRAEDTVIQKCENLIDQKRVFLSEVKNDNPLDCLVKLLRINRLPPNMDSEARENAKKNCDYYYDMMYLLPYCTFVSLPPDNMGAGSESDSTISSEADVTGATVGGVEVCQDEPNEIKLLDLYAGCGAMSTGLCLGANSAGVKLVTKWAVDLNKYACESLKLNHPETQVRNEAAENFLSLLKEWERLCVSYSLFNSNVEPHPFVKSTKEEDEDEGEDEEDDSPEGDFDDEDFEVDEVLDICYGDPKDTGKLGLYFKIRWKNYGPEYDTWEPLDGLSECQVKVKDFVTRCYKRMTLPLPGNVDVICGGPPCQGISGFNRFRNKEEPLKDDKNQQLIVFMDIVSFLKPRFVLMENVVDLVKFSGGFLGRYAFVRLVDMNYQARLGMMAAGAYGLPQFRMRVFMWGALPTEKLPQYPLPTHNVVFRGVVPKEFESNLVAFEEGYKVELEKELFLGDAISDLPEVQNDELRDEMPYRDEAKTEFQRFIRLTKDEMPGSLEFGLGSRPHLLYDHRPLKLNDDDYNRVCQIPVKKGANFRDLAGVRVRPDNKVEWNPDVDRVYLKSGKPLVPDYAMSFVNGSSSK